MLSRTFKFLLIILIIFSGVLSAQSYRFGNDWDDWDDDVFDWYGDSRPMIEVNYGLGKLSHKGFADGRFADIGSIELKLGYSEIDTHYEDYLIELDSRYIFGSRISDVLRSDYTPEDFQYTSELYRFGFGKREGYGYKFGPVSLIPYTQGALTWSKFNSLKRNQALPAGFTELNSVQPVADRYGNAFRFGSLAEAGVMLQAANMIGFNVSYEGSVMYPRLLVWKWMGSVILEHAGYAAIGEFVEEIMDRVPAAGPVMNVLLRGGFQYAFFQLRKDKMNWPFDTESPLTYEQVKFSVTLTF